MLWFKATHMGWNPPFLLIFHVWLFPMCFLFFTCGGGITLDESLLAPIYFCWFSGILALRGDVHHPFELIKLLVPIFRVIPTIQTMMCI